MCCYPKQTVLIPIEPNTSKSTYPQEDSGSMKQQVPGEDSQEDSTNLKKDSENTVDIKHVKGEKSKHAESKKDTKVPTSTKREEPEVRIQYFE